MPDLWGTGYIEWLGLFQAPSDAENRTGIAVPWETFGLPYGLGWTNKTLKVVPLELPTMALGNLGAELGVIGDPGAVDFDNGSFTTRFVNDLPPPVYPLAFDGAKALAGRRSIYDAKCGGCHYQDSGKGYDVGTDSNRSNGLTEESRKALGRAMLASCGTRGATDPRCSVSIDAAVTTPRSYLTPPLDGIWARAPYFQQRVGPHAPQVLPAPRRQTTFVRGNIAYDKVEVGFDWKSGGGNRAVFDTSKEGFSNRGHEFGAELDSRARDALLEHLKTL